MKSPRGANLGSPGGFFLYIFLPCRRWLIFFQTRKRWLGHFHQVASALHDSFSCPIISPLLSFLAHQLLRCLMSLQVQHVLHPPLILTPASASLSFSLTSRLYSLSPCPLLSLTRLELCNNQSLHLFPFWHLSFIPFLLFTWNVSLCLILFKCLKVKCTSRIWVWSKHRRAVCASQTSANPRRKCSFHSVSTSAPKNNQVIL